MKNLFKHILFGAAIFAGMGLFVGCDTMTNDEIEQLINDKINAADATPSVALAGTTWVAYDDDDYLDEHFGYEVYEKYTLSFTETTLSFSSKTYKKEDDSLVDEWDLFDSNLDLSDDPNYYVQGNIIITNIPATEQPIYLPKEDCIIWAWLVGSKFYRVEE